MAQLAPLRRRDEQGMALAYAVLIVVAIVGLTSVIMVNARASEEEARLTADRVITQPHVQSAITGFRMALGARLATEADGFTLSPADMVRLAPSTGTAADFVTTTAQLPLEYRTVGGVWQRQDARTMTPVTEHPMPAVAFHATASADPQTCQRLGLAARSCRDDLHGFWQVYRIELPDRTALDANGNVVAYFRAWLQSVDASSRPVGAVTSPTVVRAELRPGRFADYQLISDGQIQFGHGAEISGPVHSNGFELGRNHLTGVDPATTAIAVRDGVDCTGSGSLSTAEGAINMPSSFVCATQQDTNRFISFLRVFDELEQLTADASAGLSGSLVLPTVDRPGVPGRLTAWRAQLRGTHVRFTSPDGAVRNVPAGSGTTGVLVEDDLVIEGGDLDGRMTIGARRVGAGSANIYVTGDVNKNTTRPGRTFGLIAQGDIVVEPQRRGSGWSCPTTLRAAMIAASGGLTIPPQYTTPEIQPDPPQCDEALIVDGSVAGHRSPNLQWQWDGWDDPVNYPGRWAGYANRQYRWDTRLLSSPPPYFPLTGTWQAVSVRIGNVDCYAGDRRADARCR
ncbi:MAG: hypothetical protein JWO69_1748 [Thermoleophilia bacterium]|jgi:hypothetical protein|nr:hypothetical protein [Thermoleophilia bacterium]